MTINRPVKKRSNMPDQNEINMLVEIENKVGGHQASCASISTVTQDYVMDHNFTAEKTGRMISILGDAVDEK
ncbi:hypothetical protein CJF42_12530 [Pseudoalteromonas sp. NBT06-2]|uniref:hypothetical protein n=1 Tax=Pseudoalteromonas sp. NBT06-2 TaxID=2025950 RepID=UPI000BA6D8ED|nr:hypothetical protein [Pseudoalteromonas sp. NBT06-2]PAJ74051.1 hypothetical protein CJF42_12530 [Pseudoalteromonas sp. NBT06-2]